MNWPQYKEVKETMTATDAYVRIMMREREKGSSQERAAASANVGSWKTVAKYEQLGKLPSEPKKPRQYRTRSDAFAGDWPTVEQMLEEAPSLEAAANRRQHCSSGCVSSIRGGIGLGSCVRSSVGCRRGERCTSRR